MNKILFRLLILIALPATYVLFPVHHVSAFTATQEDFRWYVNEDAQEETDPWPPGGTDLAEDTAITASDSPPTDGDAIRVRVNVNLSGSSLSPGQATIHLQFATGTVCSSINTWTPVGAVGSGSIWRYYDNANVTDGSTLGSTLLSSSNVKQSYQESNPSSAPNGINDGETAEWDFSLQDNGAAAGTSYCFRIVSPNQGPLDVYSNYPQLVTQPFSVKSQDWMWFGDEEHETPTSTLAATNTRPIGIRQQDVIKLRLTLDEQFGTDGANQKFRIEFGTSTDFEAPLFAEESGSCTTASIWCYGDGADADDDAITTRLLTDSGTSGRHNESGTSASTFTHSASAAVEYEFTLMSNGADPNTLYYFRAYDVNNATSVQANTGETYPYLQTRAPLLSFAVEGVDANTQIHSYTTNVASTASGFDFGNIDLDQTYLTAQRMRVTEDGLGYQVSVYSNGPLISAHGDTVVDFDGTNATPLPWSTYTPGPTYPSAFGYHAGDDLLSEGSTRFLDADTWAGLSATPGEIVYTSGTVEDDVHDILYRLEVSTYQAAQRYSTEIVYVVVATY
ncbi:hypothetical protein K8R04_01480 [Candidatus Uhrbacteria bacterium]|nr:hypothetical protein [Candidatus Uhrbacteria bacterium]